MLTLSVVILLLILLAAGVPVAFSLGIAGTAGLLYLGGPAITAGILGTAPLSAVTSFELISVPMFLLMAEFVILSDVAHQLFRTAATWVGRVPGGLGIATALAGAGFGAISGSSTASAATLSAITVPAMMKQGYEPKMACGVVAISGTLAMLIPPSVALVLYGIIADVNIGKLLIAGVIPGLLVMVTIILTVYALVKLDPSRAPQGSSYTMAEKFRSLATIGPVLLLFMAVTGTIYTGIATPTEASGLGAFGAFLIALWRGKVNRVTMVRALVSAAGTSCMIFLIIVGARVFGYFITLTQTTQSLVTAVGAWEVSPYVILMLIVLMYVILGAIMDQIAILILTVPVVLPVIVSLGFDPIWFGVLVVIIAEIGLLTPPVGLNVFVVARYTGRAAREVFAGVWPHVFAHFIVIGLMIAFPWLITWLPSRMQ